MLPSMDNQRLRPILFYKRMIKRCNLHEIGTGGGDEVNKFFHVWSFLVYAPINSEWVQWWRRMYDINNKRGNMIGSMISGYSANVPVSIHSFFRMVQKSSARPFRMYS